MDGVARVAVADDRDAAAARLADGAPYRVPVGGGVRQLAHGARVQGDGRGAQLQQYPKPLVEDVALDAEPGLDRHRQTARAVARGSVDLAHAAGVGDQRGAGALLQHAPVRAAGVYVDAVEAEAARELGALVEGLRPRAEELHHQRALAGMEGELRQQPLAPARTQPFAGGELGHHQVGPAAARDDLPERGVGDVGHRRQQQHRARQGVPERIDLHGPSPYVCWRPPVQTRRDFKGLAGGSSSHRKRQPQPQRLRPRHRPRRPPRRISASPPGCAPARGPAPPSGKYAGCCATTGSQPCARKRAARTSTSAGARTAPPPS